MIRNLNFLRREKQIWNLIAFLTFYLVLFHGVGAWSCRLGVLRIPSEQDSFLARSLAVILSCEKLGQVSVAMLEEEVHKVVFDFGSSLSGCVWGWQVLSGNM